MRGGVLTCYDPWKPRSSQKGRFKSFRIWNALWVVTFLNIDWILQTRLWEAIEHTARLMWHQQIIHCQLVNQQHFTSVWLEKLILAVRRKAKIGFGGQLFWNQLPSWISYFLHDEIYHQQRSNLPSLRPVAVAIEISNTWGRILHSKFAYYSLGEGLLALDIFFRAEAQSPNGCIDNGYPHV